MLRTGRNTKKKGSKLDEKGPLPLGLAVEIHACSPRRQRNFLPLDDFFSVAAGRGLDGFYNDKVRSREAL